MSVDHVVSADLAVLAAENRRAVPSVDAVLRKAGIGADPAAAAVASPSAQPAGVTLVAMSQVFSRRVGRAAVGLGLFAVGIFTVVTVRKVTSDASETLLSVGLLRDYVLRHRGIVIALLAAPLYLIAARLASTALRSTLESARNEGEARDIAARFIRGADAVSLGLGLAGVSAMLMICGFVWYLAPLGEWLLTAFTDRSHPMSWRDVELFAVFGGGVLAAGVVTVLVIRERRSQRARRVLTVLASARTIVAAALIAFAVYGAVKTRPTWARWTADYIPEDYTMQYEMYRVACRWPNRCDGKFGVVRVPWARAYYQPRKALTGVGGAALFVFATGLALRRRRREHEL